MTDRMKLRIYAGTLAAALLLGGCGSGSGSVGTTAAETTAAETTAAETTAAETTAPAETTAKETDSGETAAAEEKTTAAETASEETAATEEETTAAETQPETTEAETETETAEAATEEASSVSLTDVYDAITQEVALNSPMIVPEDFISSYLGVDISSIGEYLFVMSEMATSAETIVIIKTDDSNRQALTDTLQMVLNQKAAEMENYLPDQFDIVSKSSVEQTGDYLYLVISENADAIRKIIEAKLQ